MVMVRALQKCFIDNRMKQAGAEFDYDGEINENVLVALEDLEPVKKPKPSKVAKASKKKLAKAKPVDLPGLPNAVLPGPPKTDS